MKHGILIIDLYEIINIVDQLIQRIFEIDNG